MFTSLDKALVAFVMSALFILNHFFGITFGFTESQVTGFLAVLMPLAVYFWPNKKTS